MNQAADTNFSIRIRPAHGWSALRLSELWEFRDVLIMLALRDVKLRYKQTVLGIVWVVLQPLAAGFIFALIFGRFAKLPSAGHDYVLYVFAALAGWNLFAGILQRSGNSLVAETKLITKVYFPRLLVPCAAGAAVLVDYLVSLTILAALLAWHGVWSGWWLCLAPVATALIFVLSLGVSFWVSALNVRYRDFMYALPFVIQVWMYASPVVYSLDLIPEALRPWFLLNPMSGALTGIRAAFLGGTDDVWLQLALAFGAAIVLFFSGAYYFRRVERGFADSL